MAAIVKGTLAAAFPNRAAVSSHSRRKTFTQLVHEQAFTDALTADNGAWALKEAM